MAKTEQLVFKQHPALLIAVIKEQAGTLWKAILEGLMNIVDAEATEASLEITRDKIILSDNGRGFQSREEVDQNFAVFGMPQKEVEQQRKKYGKFRMGRGQMFSFGVNTWRSGEFKMVVDINNPPKNTDEYELPFPLTSGLEHHQGCRVEIKLYRKLNNLEHRELLEQIQRVAQYIAIPVTLNGEVFTKDPAKCQWDHVTDEAYIRFRQSGQLTIYNQGVLVMELGNYKLGCGGTVVCRQAPKVNFARNDIMSDCPVWQAVRKHVNREATRRNTRANRLDDGARARLAQQLKDGELEDSNLQELRIFTDVTGKHWGMRLMSYFSDDFTVAPMYDSRGDKLMQRKLAFVFAKDTLDRFDVNSVEELLEIIRDHMPHSRFLAVPYEEATKGMDEYHELVPEVDWNGNERLVISLLTSAQGYLLHNAPPDMGDMRARTITVGESDVEGWTDGRSYICISRHYIKQAGVMASAWASYGHLLIHEYCHDTNSAGSHIHSDEFYRHYHDWTANHHALGGFFAHCLHQLPTKAGTVQRQMTKAMLRNQDKVEKAQKAADKVAAKS